MTLSKGSLAIHCVRSLFVFLLAFSFPHSFAAASFTYFKEVLMRTFPDDSILFF